MDPFSAEGELTNLHTAFHTGQYPAVAAFDPSSLSETNALPARILSLRARLALSQHDSVIEELSGSSLSDPNLQAVLAYAQYTSPTTPDPPQLSTLSTLASSHGRSNPTCLILAATALVRSGQDGAEKQALSLLEKHEGSLDCVALIVQIHLSMNRLDLAQGEVRKARSWAQDAMLVNLCEAWVGLREGGPAYQPAFYVYEELATAPPTLPTSDDTPIPTNTLPLLAQSIAELHLGRLPEAEAAMNTALEQDPDSPDVLANAVVLNTVMGKRAEAKELLERLRGVDEGHEMCRGVERGRERFEEARGRYKPVFEVA